MMTSSQVALWVIQQAIFELAKWAEVDLPKECQRPDDNNAIARAKEILSWTDKVEIKPLQLLFDSVKLSDGKHPDENEPHYCPAVEIANENPTIPYPKLQEPTPAELKCLKLQIQDEINQLKFNQQDWQNLSLLTLILEKFGSHLSFGESDISLVDMARSIAAIAEALVNYPQENQISLIAGDLSGIQNFIYTISSDGALKSLRARSFYLELVAEEIVQQLLEELDLPRISIIYAGGGNLYLLAPAHENTKTVIQKVKTTFNKWLLNKFQTKIFLALAVSEPFPAEDVATDKFAEHWDIATKAVNQQKSHKFINQVGDLLKLKPSYEQRCRVCHRDDTPNLKEVENDDGELIIQCSTCQKMSRLGSQLFKTRVVVRSRRKDIPGKLGKVSFQFVHYYLFESQDNLPELQEEEIVFHINNWKTQSYRHRNSVSWLLGNYGQKSEEKEPNFIRAFEMARKAEGINRVGYLRMDVDNLGKIFAKGLKEKTIHNLPRIAGLSRQMSYFFKVYLNSLAKERYANLPKGAKGLNQGERPNLLFIYAGGDDLFISGAWNEAVEFALDVYQSFQGYTGRNPDITLSGGISIADIKFPLYQAADESGEAERNAKGNGRDSLGLFGDVFKWSEWLGTANIEAIDSNIQGYLKPENFPKLFGILPFVERLHNIDTNYSHSFVRNLLATAQVQKQMIKAMEEKGKNEKNANRILDIRYYLHLPKLAYTLARLPNQVLNDEEFRTSLKSPYNAPYFQAIATWIELLTRKQSYESNNG
jgi:CRISPR-associated protein Csm1